MLPIAMSVISLLIDDADGFTKNDQNFALSVMLGIAFSNLTNVAIFLDSAESVLLIYKHLYVELALFRPLIRITP